MSKKSRKYFRQRPRRVLPVYVGECPECHEVVRDLYDHLLTSHDGWEPFGV